MDHGMRRAPPIENEDAGISSRIISLMGAARRLKRVHSGSFDETVGDCKLRWKAKRAKPSSSLGQATLSNHEVLEPGSLVQVIMSRTHESSVIVRPHSTGDCVLGIFLVIGFLDGGGDGPWVAGVRCRKIEKDVIRIPKEMGHANLHLLQLSKGIRRIGVYHMCRYPETCQIDRESRSVRHSETTLSGGSFRIQTRNQGYPPRLA